MDNLNNNLSNEVQNADSSNNAKKAKSSDKELNHEDQNNAQSADSSKNRQR